MNQTSLNESRLIFVHEWGAFSVKGLCAWDVGGENPQLQQTTESDGAPRHLDGWADRSHCLNVLSIYVWK